MKNNLEGFTQRQIKEATTTRTIQNSTGLATSSLITVVDKKMLNNFLITRESIKHALSIWGQRVPDLDGKTTRTRGDTVLLSEESIVMIPLPLVWMW